MGNECFFEKPHRASSNLLEQTSTTRVRPEESDKVWGFNIPYHLKLRNHVMLKRAYFSRNNNHDPSKSIINRALSWHSDI